MQHSHRRKNILTGEWIQVSPHRTKRPWQGKLENHSISDHVDFDKTCYLCPGNVRSKGEENPNYKQVFVFENDFSALQYDVKKQQINKQDLLIAKAEKGICKVVCFSPKHNASLASMSIAEIQSVVELWKDEYLSLGQLEHINHVQIFENKGDVMGCSNAHPHGQIWAQESIPQEVAKECEQQLIYYKDKKTNLLQDYVNLELQLKERVIFTNDSFVVLVPFWAIWPFETMIVPRVAIPSMKEFNEQNSKDFAEAIKEITSKYDKLFDCSFPYSSGIHQAPTDGKAYSEWTMHMHFYPPLLRSATVKKFMVGYEMMANPQRDFTPEYAAEMLNNIE